jgi:hypothetical protein
MKVFKIICALISCNKKSRKYFKNKLTNYFMLVSLVKISIRLNAKDVEVQVNALHVGITGKISIRPNAKDMKVQVNALHVGITG